MVVFVLVLRSDVLGVEVFFLAPTVSGDGAGALLYVTKDRDVTLIIMINTKADEDQT